MMSSATSNSSTFRPWQFFVLAGLLVATVGVFLSRGTSPANIILISLVVGGAALTGTAVYRMLAPLVMPDTAESDEMVGGRTRAALEREKMLALRSIKELEFDRAMNKISEQDYEQMAARLRSRAVGLIRRLDASASGYRELIERELASRLGRAGASKAATDAGADEDAPEPAEGACRSCGTVNETDARFCKQCGVKLAAAVLLIAALLVPALALAQPDLRMMAGIPRPDGNLPDGVITVRVVRQALANNVTGHPVELRAGGDVQTVNTDENGRATFPAPAPGTIVRAATEVDGERLESQEFPSPDRGGVAVMLVAGLGDAPAQEPGRPGNVSIGANSRLVVDLVNDRLEFYYLFEIVNPASYPVMPPEPLIFDLPSGTAGAGALTGSSPQVVVRGDHVTVTSPVPPGVTPMQIGFTIPYSGGELTVEQRLPAALAVANVVVRKVEGMGLRSAQLVNQEERQLQGEPYIMAAGPSLAAGDVFSFTLTGLPHHSRAPLAIAGLVAALIVIVGVWAGAGRRGRATDTAYRQQLEKRREKTFAELVKLEQQRRDGKIDPARHQHRRATLIGQLERIYGELDSQGGDEGLAA